MGKVHLKMTQTVHLTVNTILQIIHKVKLSGPIKIQQFQKRIVLHRRTISWMDHLAQGTDELRKSKISEE